MESSAVARSQNVVYVMPHDWASMARFLEPLVERIDESRPELQLVVIAADTESAAALSGAAVRTFAGRPIQVVAATSSTRAARLLKLRPAQMVVGIQRLEPMPTKALAILSAPPDSSSRPPSMLPRPTTRPTELRMPPNPFWKLLTVSTGDTPLTMPRKHADRISARKG